jgi:hypothetical protein
MSGSTGELRYLVTFTAAVLLPGAQAALSGFAAAVIAGSMSFYFGNDKYLVVAFLAGGVVFLLAWMGGVMWWRGRIVGKVKEPGPAQVYPSTATRVEIVASDPSGVYLAGAWADLPVDLPKLIKLARRVVLDRASFSMADLCGRHKPLSRSEFEELRLEFIARGLLVWCNPEAHAQGCELTRAGGAVLRHLSDMPLNTPLPQRSRMLAGKLLDSRGLHAHAGARASGQYLELGG